MEITNKNVFVLLIFITPKIIDLIMENKNKDYIESFNILYSSYLYDRLEDASTGLYRLSPYLLYSLLEEELTTGYITFPEEQ
jgi:stage III sporulation protein SpoIIIAA